MRPTGGDVSAFLEKVSPAARRRDAETMAKLMQEVSGREPALWGTIVGFGACRYRSASGTEGDSPVLSFAARRTSTTVYLLDGVESHSEELAELGSHTTGVSCLYLKDLADVDLDALRGILASSLERLTSGRHGYADLTVTG